MSNIPNELKYVASHEWLMRYLSFVIVCVFALSGCDAKDHCLDYGGSYNETTKQCEK